MINLLSDNKKAEIRAGRFNTIMLRYIFMTLVAAGLLVVVLASAYLALSAGRANAQSRVESSDKGTAQFAPVRKSADDYRKNLATAKQIFNKEIIYSRLLVKFSNALPPRVIVEDIHFDAASIGAPTTITFYAKTPADAAGLKQHLEKQTDLFSSVMYSQIVYESDPPVRSDYPIIVKITLTIRKEALK